MPYTYCEQIGKEIRDISDEIPFEIPESWEWVRFASIIELQSGQDLTPDKYNANENSLPYITGASNIDNETVIINRWTEHGKAFAYKGDILLTCKGTVGMIAILDCDKVHIARQIMGIHPYNGVDTDYVKLVLESLVERLKAVAKSMIPGIARDDVLFSLMPLPPLSEQRRIVAKIEELLPYIEEYNKAETQLTALNETFPEMLKKSILQEAVQGKLVPQNPYDEPASVLLERIKAEKQRLIKQGKSKKDKHEATEITTDKIPYEIPESWVWCRLGDILLKLTDGTHSTPKYIENGVPFISVKDVSTGKLNFSNCKYISEKEHIELYERCNPEIGDILLTKVGTTGIPVIVDTEKQFSLFVSVGLLKFNQELIYNRYLVYIINSPLVQKQAIENTKGVGNKNWVMRDIANTLIVIPPIEEQKRIVNKIEELMGIINKIQ